jgi:peptide chain release factor 1
MDFEPIIALKRRRFAELERLVEAPNLYDDPKAARELLREHTRAKELLEKWALLEKTRQELSDSETLAKGTDELAAMAQAELPELQLRVADMERAMQIALLPPDPNEDRDAIVEIRAGAGGSEAGLFAAELFRMYQRFAETANLSIETLDASTGDLGGIREVVFKVSGSSVFRTLRFESGVHRVQRVPATEAQGRIHTSTATVAVLPEAEEVDIEIKADELRIDVCRAGGPGGQGVNTTDSAVQVLHLPTGMIVRCQDGRSQQKNKEKALAILRARLLEKKQREEAEKHAAARKSQVGSGGREEKIRTYNFPQNRITDHRINLTLYNLDKFMEGSIQEMITALQDAELQERLQEASAATEAVTA